MIDGAVVGEVSKEQADALTMALRINLTKVDFSLRGEVKNRGAKWSPVDKLWHITGVEYACDPIFWSQWGPVDAAAAAPTV